MEQRKCCDHQESCDSGSASRVGAPSGNVCTIRTPNKSCGSQQNCMGMVWAELHLQWYGGNEQHLAATLPDSFIVIIIHSGRDVGGNHAAKSGCISCYSVGLESAPCSRYLRTLCLVSFL